MVRVRNGMRNFGERTLALLGASFLQALCVVMIARQAGPAEFGEYALGVSLAVIIGTFLGFGSTTRALRVLREADPNLTASSLTACRLAIAVVSFVLVGSALVVLGSDPLVGLSIALIGAVDHFCDFEQILLAGLLEHRRSAFVILIRRALPTVFVAVAFMLDLNTIVSHALASIVVASVVVVMPLKRVLGQFDFGTVWKGSLGYWWGSVSSAAQQLDVAIVQITLGSVGVGIYGAANRLVIPLSIVANSASVAFSPNLGQITDSLARYKAFGKFAVLSTLPGALLVIGSPLVGELVVRVLGADYEAARPIIVGATVAIGIGSVVPALQSYLYMEGRAKTAALFTFLAVVSGLISLYFAGNFLGSGWLWLGLIVNYSVVVLCLTIWFVSHKPRTAVMG